MSDASNSLADLIDDAGPWTRLTKRSLFRSAASHIRRQLDTEMRLRHDLKQSRITNTQLKKSLSEADAEAKEITKRATLAINELSLYKSGSRHEEKPAALIMSPWQLAQMTFHGFVRPGRREENKEGAVIHTFMDVPIYTARGVYGPVAMTEAAFASFTRQAPELNIKAC